MKVLARIGEALGERAYRDAVTNGAPVSTRPGVGIAVAFLVSLVVLASPFAIAAGAVAIAYSNFPAPMALIIAALLLALSWFLFPRRPSRPQRALGRDKLPETFRLVDAVGKALSSPRIDAIAINGEFNAYLAEQSGFSGKRTRVLGLGMLLWAAATNEERIALVAHELGHATNGDPRRGRIIGRAMEVLSRWAVMLDRDLARHSSAETGFSGLIVELFYLLIHAIIGAVSALLGAATMYQSQIAEYRADASGAQVAGAEATIGLLEKVTLWTESEVFHNLYGTYHRRQRGRELIASIIARQRNLGADERRAILEKARAERHSIDATHPPTVFRQAFIERHAQFRPTLNVPDVDFGAIDRELAHFVEETGNAIAARRDASLQ